jgi:hypothetical protein
MASGPPRQLNDPSVMASVEAPVRSAARPGLATRLWHWRYEAALIAGVLLGTIAIGATLSLDWLIAAAAAALAVPAAALAWPSSRRWSRTSWRAACWAGDGRVVNDRRSHIVVLEVIRRWPPGRHAGGGPNPARNHLDRGRAAGPDAGEPILYAGYGHLWPFG